MSEKIIIGKSIIFKKDLKLYEVTQIPSQECSLEKGRDVTYEIKNNTNLEATPLTAKREDIYSLSEFNDEFYFYPMRLLASSIPSFTTFFYYPSYNNMNDRLSSWVRMLKSNDISTSIAFGKYIAEKIPKILKFDGVVRALGHDEKTSAAKTTGLDYFSYSLCEATNAKYYTDKLFKKRTYRKFSSGMSVSERREALKDNYYFNKIPCKKLLVVDDIVTSGSTLKAIYEAYLKMPQQTFEIYFLCLGWTIGRHEPRTKQVKFDYTSFTNYIEKYKEKPNIQANAIEVVKQVRSVECQKYDVLFIFDLDMTLIDSSIAEDCRKNRMWGKTYSLIEKFKPYEIVHKLRAYLAELVDGELGFPNQIFGTFQTFVVTSSPRSYCEKVLSFFKIQDIFDGCVCYHDTKNHKPNPEPLRKAAEFANIDLDSKHSVVFVIGDKPEDIKAAKACGAISIAASWGRDATEEIMAEKPKYVCRDFDELTNCIALELYYE